MLRNKQSSSQQAHTTITIPEENEQTLNHETHLLNFLDNFDIYQFIIDDDYRQRLNDLLELFTDEEFDAFERSHINRFVMN